jgi:hypothetical protein
MSRVLQVVRSWLPLVFAVVFWLSAMLAAGYVVMVLLPNFPFPSGCRP